MKNIFKKLRKTKTEKKLIRTINTMISLCEPVKYKEFRRNNN